MKKWISSFNGFASSSLRQNTDTLELRIEELSKQVEEVSQTLELERRKNERLREMTANDSPAPLKALNKVRHLSSASEPENEEVCINHYQMFQLLIWISSPGFIISQPSKDIHELRTKLIGSHPVHELLTRLLQHSADLFTWLSFAW